MRSPKSQILAFILFLTATNTNAATPVFVKAIQSALGSMPLSGFPMSAGLTSAKLAVGGKLLYFLGLFGRQTPNQMPFQNGYDEMQQFNGGFPGGNQFGNQGFRQGFPQQNMGFSNQIQSKPPVNPAAIMSALAQQGINPLQLMQALESAGVDPMQMMQSLSGSPSPGNISPPLSGPGNRAGQGRPKFQTTPSTPPPGLMNEMPHDLSDSLPPDSENLVNEPVDEPVDPADSNADDESEDVESFFSFMKDMDDNKCISRLICDIGADPDFLGEFSRNIANIISTLDVTPESGAYDYIQIMENGRRGLNCAESFSQCDEEAYDMVKNVAPSVGVPSGVTSDAINKL